MDNNAAFVMVLIIPLLAMNERMWLVHSLREPLAHVEVKQMKIDIKKIIKRKSGKKTNPATFVTDFAQQKPQSMFTAEAPLITQ